MPVTGVKATGDIGDIANALFDAIENADITAVEQLWAPDIAVWHTGDTGDNDRARALRVIRWFIDHTAERRYEILDRTLFESGFVQQHILHATGTNGSSVAIRVCIVIKLGATRLISRIDEYFDPKDVAALL